MLDGATIARRTAPTICLSRIGLTVNGTRILSSVDLVIASGATTAVMGPNGAGKTSLLRIIMGLTEPTQGQITQSGEGWETARRSFVFQKPVMLRRTVAANVAFALTAAGRTADAGSIDRLLAVVGLATLAGRPARRLSGGEQQRLALARALAREPDILLLDEPTASLDPTQTRLVEEILQAVAASGVKVVLSTHSRGQAKRLAGDVVFLVGGRVVEHTPTREFFDMPRTDEARRFLAGDLVI